MSANKLVRIGPVALTTTLTTNILNAPTLTGGVSAGGTANAAAYFVLRHITVVNKTASAASLSLWIGATGANAAGTEFLGIGQSVPANSKAEWFGALRLDAADFLVGGSGTATALTFEAEGEIGIA